jgi:DNA-binding transcriptional ArsR family regulator
MTTTNPCQETTAETRVYRSEREASLDATFDALVNRRCRVVLRQLAESEDALGVDDLVTQLVEELDDDAASETRLRTALHHAHLPKLADAGLVDYDPDCGLVRFRADSRFEAMDSTIESLESTDPPISADTLLDLLANVRRRHAVATLVRHDSLSLADLADEVAIAERDELLSNIDADDVLKVYLSLYHTHIPKLAATGLVEYDQRDDYVALAGTGRALESPVRSLCTLSDG